MWAAGRRYAFGDNFDPAYCNTFETHIRSTTLLACFLGRDPGRVGRHDGQYLGLDQQSLYGLPLQRCRWSGRSWTPGARRVVRGGSWLVLQVYARPTATTSIQASAATAWACGWRGRPPVWPEALGSDGLTKSAYQTSCTFFRLWR